MTRLIQPDTVVGRARIGAIFDRYPTVGAYAANVIPHPAARTPFTNWPTVSHDRRRGIIRLSWCNLSATFTTNTIETDALLIAEEHDWFDVDPAGRLIAGD
jgi:hypothetical protein